MVKDSLQALVRLSVVVQVGRRIETAFCFTCHKQHLALPHPAHTHTHRLEGCAGLSGSAGVGGGIPEEEAQASSTGEGVGGAGTNILPVHLRLTAVALRAEQRTTHQTQSRSARLVSTRPGTPATEKDGPPEETGEVGETPVGGSKASRGGEDNRPTDVKLEAWLIRTL